MSVSRFNADVRAAARRASEGKLEGVSSVSRGDIDGEVVLTLANALLPSPISIRALCNDLDEYPNEASFMLFTDSDDAPSAVPATITYVQNFSFGKKIIELVLDVSRALARELSSGSAENQPASRGARVDDVVMTDQDDDDESLDGSYDDADDDVDWDMDFEGPSNSTHDPNSTSYHAAVSSKLWPALQGRIKRDLRTTHMAGFKIGIIEGLRTNTGQQLLSLSIRVHKLALSDEAMQAWDLAPSDYIVLLIRYFGPYISLDQIIELPAARVRVDFRIGKCNRCKPSTESARAAFLTTIKVTKSQSVPDSTTTTERPSISSSDSKDTSADFHKLFISNSLNQHMEENFLSLLKLRVKEKVSWDAANEYLIRFAGTAPGDSGSIKDIDGLASNIVNDNEDVHAAACLNDDHLCQAGERSFPLIAMQFAMRYFVRCTEFCLRCHRRLHEGFESLKPYVCENPLCLYQYMALGFGPSVEHEILTEPLVVDLLISFCYAAVQTAAPPNVYYNTQSRYVYPIRHFPKGLRLNVPDLSESLRSPDSSSGAGPVIAGPGAIGTTASTNGNPASGSKQARDWVPATSSAKPTGPIKVTISANDSLVVDKFEDVHRIKLMSWVAFVQPQPQAAPFGQTIKRTSLHARVIRRSFESKIIEVDNITASYIGLSNESKKTQSFATVFGSIKDLELIPYETDFDSLGEVQKGHAIADILNTLPSIASIRQELVTDPGKTLRDVTGVSPAAESLLRWIISSNRSCIFQVSKYVDQSSNQELGRTREHEEIDGMAGFIQFRFAQGAPDKELRFLKARREVAARRNSKFPSIFAWHGSRTPNWHSIVRNGLDFAQTMNGRAYGNGVYFSPDYSTSLSYSAGGAKHWPNSTLRVGMAMSLIEIVNARDEFVSHAPHYVVAQQDWHQCRYLFVQQVAPITANPGGAASTSNTLNLPGQSMTSRAGKQRQASLQGTVLQQDPTAQVRGPGSANLGIPLAASSGSQVSSGLQQKESPRGSHSDEEDVADADFLFDDDEDDEQIEIEQQIAGETAVARLCSTRNSSVDTATAIERKAESNRPLTPAQLDISGTDFRPGVLDLESLPRTGPPTSGTGVALKALSVEVQKMQKLQNNTPLHELGWYIDFEHTENIFQWIVELHSFEKTLPLAQDMRRAKMASIVLEIRFGVDFPITPPFVRVIRPRFLPFTMGGGGHVTAGGAMCMELLTNSGWSPANSMESVIMQVRMAITNTEPRPARLENSRATGQQGNDYGIGEAIEAYERAARTHGWAIPPGLRASVTGRLGL